MGLGTIHTASPSLHAAGWLPADLPPCVSPAKGFAGSRPSLSAVGDTVSKQTDSRASPGILQERFRKSGTSNHGARRGVMLHRTLVAPAADPTSDVLGQHANRRDLLWLYSKKEDSESDTTSKQIEKNNAVVWGSDSGTCIGEWDRLRSEGCTAPAYGGPQGEDSAGG